MPTNVIIAAISESLEAHALRESLEQFGAQVNLISVGRPQHFIDLIQNPQDQYLIVSCHGDDRGMLFPELHQDLAGKESFGAICSAQEITRYAQFDQQTIISTGCMTGSDALAEAYLASGAAVYVAPRGSPEAHSAFFFTTQLFYGLLIRELALPEAMSWCRKTDEECARFHYWSH